MLHQHDVEVVDDDLAREEHDRLQAFSEGNRNVARIRQLPGRRRLRQEIGSDHSNHTGEHRALDAKSQTDEQEGSAEPDQSFQHEVHGQGAECVNPLDVSAPHSERNVEGGSQGEQRNQNRIGQIQVVHQRPVEEEQEKPNRDAGDPAAKMQSVKDLRLCRQPIRDWRHTSRTRPETRA